MDENRIATNLANLQEKRFGALLPYLTAGFPNADVTRRLIEAADRTGAACIEIGFPFSDSLADGPVIQESFHQVLSNGWTVDDAMDIVRKVRPTVTCGLIAMVSFSIVHRHGVGTFMKQAAAAGFDGIILPDVPTEEAESIKHAAQRVGLAYIGLVAPSTSSSRRDAILRDCSGFVYRIAASGTTGERSQLPTGLKEDVESIRQQCGLPVCVGFGVSTADQVREVCAVADGAIVGSAIVRRIADGVSEGLTSDELVERVSAFIEELMTGTRIAQKKDSK